MDKERPKTQCNYCTEDGVQEPKVKQVLSNLSHAQQAAERSTEEKVLANLNHVRSDRIQPPLRQRACFCAQDLLCFHDSTSDLSVCVLHNLAETNIDRQPFANGLKCSKVSNSVSNDPKYSTKSDRCALHYQLKNYSINESDKTRTRSSTVKSVRRIGVFYSDLCDVVKSMRSFSSAQSSNSSFKSDQPDKENLLDELTECSKVIKTMVKTPLNQQSSDTTTTNQQNGITNQQQTTKSSSISKLNVNQFSNQQPYFGSAADDQVDQQTDHNDDKMNEQLITKDKQSLLGKGSSSEQNLFKQLQHSQLLLQVPADSTNFNNNTTTSNNQANTTQTNCTVNQSGTDEVDAFRFSNSQQYQLNHANSVSTTVTVNNGQLSNVNSITNHCNLSQQPNILNSRPAPIPIANLPDLLHSHVPLPPPVYEQYNPISNNSLSLRQMSRLQQPIAINTLPNNLTGPLTLNVARSRSSTAALLGSAPLSPNNNLLNARAHHSLSAADNYRNTLSNPLTNQSVPITQPNNTATATVPLSAVTQPTVVPPHVHHHQFRFPMNTHRFTASSGHFLGPDLDAITQSKSCLSCTSMGLRWGILLIAFIGLLCSIAGTCLFAIRPTGRDNFTLAIILLGKFVVFFC